MTPLQSPSSHLPSSRPCNRERSIKRRHVYTIYERSIKRRHVYTQSEFDSLIILPVASHKNARKNRHMHQAMATSPRYECIICNAIARYSSPVGTVVAFDHLLQRIERQKRSALSSRQVGLDQLGHRPAKFLVFKTQFLVLNTNSSFLLTYSDQRIECNRREDIIGHL